jgi:hypothetical protein
MNGIAQLLTSIAALLWPIVALVMSLTFKRELRTLAGRLKKGKFLGQEIELNEEIRQLDAFARKAEVEVQVLGSAAPPPKLLPPPSEGAPNAENKNAMSGGDDLSGGSREDVYAISSRILLIAKDNPRAALMLAAAEIERKMRRILLMTGYASQLASARNITDITTLVERLGQFPQHLGDSLRQFWKVRNDLVHGNWQEHETAAIMSALDSAISMLRVLFSIPHEINIIYDPGVPFYSDSGCTKRIEDARAVLLTTVSPGGATRTRRVFPTARTDYAKGQLVAWEWNMGRVWNAAWYRDPDTGAIGEAWGSSAEFVGRPLDAQISIT